MYDAFAPARLRPLHDLDPRLFQLSFGQPVSYSIRGIGRAREEARIGSTKRCRNGFETAGAMANWMAGHHGPPVGRHQPSCLSQAPSSLYSSCALSKAATLQNCPNSTTEACCWRWRMVALARRQSLQPCSFFATISGYSALRVCKIISHTGDWALRCV